MDREFQRQILQGKSGLLTKKLFLKNSNDENVRNSATIAEIKRKLLTVIRPLKKSLFGVFDIDGVKQLKCLDLNLAR